MNIKGYMAICGVFIGCCSNVVFLELLVKYDPGSGHLITFLQFFFIACRGLIFTSKFFTVKPVIAMKDYVALVVMFFTSSVCNNYALNFNIPMPLHMIFRSGSLMANMVMGIIILRKSYDFWKYFSVVLITIGIIFCTIASGSSLKEADDKKNVTNVDGVSALFWWSIGILLMTATLFISARMGLYQETLFKKYGKHPDEALFFTHILPLPGFLLLSKNIYEHAVIAIHSKPYEVFNFTLPTQVIFIIGNVITQYMCIGSVYVLTTECPSLTVTLVMTLRRFASLIFSIIYFKNPFTTHHWIGTLFVFIGTVIFTEILPNMGKSFEESAIAIRSQNDYETIDKYFLKKPKLVNFKLQKPHVQYKKLKSVDDEI